MSDCYHEGMVIIGKIDNKISEKHANPFFYQNIIFI